MRKNVLFTLAMIAMISFTANLFAAAPDLADEPSYTAKKLAASGSIAIDAAGTDAAWAESDEASSLGANEGSKIADDTDCSFKWKAVWNDEKIFILVTVTDDVVLKRHTDYETAEVEAWMGDNIELFFNPTGERKPDGEDTYALTNASQHRLVVGQESVSYEITCDQTYTIMQVDTTYGYEIDYPGTGYVAEIWYTWDAILPEDVTAPNPWGFTINVGDADDKVTKRDGIALWAGAGLSDQQWLSVNYFGLLNLSPTEVGVVGIEENTVSTFNVYPNPATSILNVNGATEVSIYNITGQLVKAASVVEGTVDVADLVSGVYVVKSGAETRTVVIK